MNLDDMQRKIEEARAAFDAEIARMEEELQEYKTRANRGERIAEHGPFYVHLERKNGAPYSYRVRMTTNGSTNHLTQYNSNMFGDDLAREASMKCLDALIKAHPDLE